MKFSDLALAILLVIFAGVVIAKVMTPKSNNAIYIPKKAPDNK